MDSINPTSDPNQGGQSSSLDQLPTKTKGNFEGCDIKSPETTSPLKSALKKPGETSPRKEVSWPHDDSQLTHESNAPHHNIDDVTSQPKSILKPKPNNYNLSLSGSIYELAEKIQENRKNEYDDAIEQLNQLLKEYPNCDETSVKLINEKMALLKDNCKKASKYATWSKLRHSLLDGNTNIASRLKEAGKNISSDWTKEELVDDFSVIEKEEWAKPENSTYQEVKTMIANLNIKARAKEALAREQEAAFYQQIASQAGAANQSSKISEQENKHSNPKGVSHSEIEDPYAYTDLASESVRYKKNADGTTNYDNPLDMNGNETKRLLPTHEESTQLLPGKNPYGESCKIS